MDVEQVIDTAREELLGAREQVDAALAGAFRTLDRLEEENRRLRRESIERSLQVYTEQEAADVLKVGYSTLRRHRTELNLPHFRLAEHVRYTQEHLVRIAQILERPAGPREVEQQELQRLA